MLNYERVQNLREEIGEDDFEEVVALFLEEADEAIERLEPDVGAQQLETDFHALKGSALNLGFDRFAEICATAEKQAAE
ncbi:MAG: Hpt domain-containing protein, partial [Pseudomonadota bacterium]